MEPQPSTSQGYLTECSLSKNKRPKLTSFTLNEKELIIKTYKHVKETWPTDRYPYRKEMAKITASNLSIGLSSVYRILKDYKKQGKISAPLMAKPRLKVIDKIDDSTKLAIRKKILAFYLKGELPTLDQILKAVNEDNSLPNFKRTTFLMILNRLKYEGHQEQRNNTDRDGSIELPK